MAKDTSGDVGGGFEPFSFAQVTDLHLAEDRGPQRLEAFVEDVRSRPEIAFVLVTGDLMWPGQAEHVRRLFEQLDRPVQVIFGNNDADQLATLELAFGARDKLFEYGRCLFVMWWDCLPHAPRENHRGDWTEQQQRWIEAALQDGRNRGLQHLFLVSHVPPAVPQGAFPIFFMREAAEERLYDLCRRYGITACLFGHIHQEDHFRRDGAEILVTPSLNWNFVPNEAGKFERRETGQAYRLITVTADGIEHQLMPVRLNGE